LNKDHEIFEMYRYDRYTSYTGLCFSYNNLIPCWQLDGWFWKKT